MGIFRIIALVLGIGLLGFAAFLILKPQPKPVEPVAPTAPVATAPAEPAAVDVLVAATALPVGHTLAPADLVWRPLPADAVTPDMVRRSDDPDGMAKQVGGIVKMGLLAGDAIRLDRLIRRETSGFLAALIAPGKRAFAISIDTKGTATAGNFILPNDRVDIIRSYQGPEGLNSETILRGIRVLAVGPSVQEAGTNASGETATVEVDLRQAELLATAQRTGQISLALRRADDIDGEDTSVSELSVTIYRQKPFMIEAAPK